MPTKEASFFRSFTSFRRTKYAAVEWNPSKVNPSRTSGYRKKAVADALEAPHFICNFRIYVFEILLSSRQRRHLFLDPSLRSGWQKKRRLNETLIKWTLPEPQGTEKKRLLMHSKHRILFTILGFMFLRFIVIPTKEASFFRSFTAFRMTKKSGGWVKPF